MAVSGAGIQAAQREDVGPQPNDDPVAALLVSQLADPSVNVPEKPWGIAALEPTQGFRFRSKPGFRKPCLTIQVPQDYGDDEKKSKHQDKMFARKYAGREDELIALQELVDDLGTRIVEFKPVPGKFEAYLDTDDPRLAAFIRSSQEFAEGRIYEELAPMTVTVNGQTIQVVPANNDARQALAAANAA
jgi:hypothetical protein